VDGSIVLSFFRPACIAHTVAILLHDYWAIYDPPSTPLVYVIHHTKLAVAISCKGQAKRRPLCQDRARVAQRLSSSMYRHIERSNIGVCAFSMSGLWPYVLLLSFAQVADLIIASSAFYCICTVIAVFAAYAYHACIASVYVYAYILVLYWECECILSVFWRRTKKKDSFVMFCVCYFAVFCEFSCVGTALVHKNTHWHWIWVLVLVLLVNPIKNRGVSSVSLWCEYVHTATAIRGVVRASRAYAYLIVSHNFFGS